MDIHFLGHAGFELRNDDVTVLIDPFLTGNPAAAVDPEEPQPTTILLTHGHHDHVGDAVDIAKRTGAPILAETSLARELADEGVDTIDPNLGGTVRFDWGSVKLVPALHGSMTPKGRPNLAAGLIIEFAGKTIYHVGDTALFSDLRLARPRDGEIDVAMLCIGGHFTMDRVEAVEAAGLIAAREIIPCHYNTFPRIETDAQAFRRDVEASTSTSVVVLEPGGTHSP